MKLNLDRDTGVLVLFYVRSIGGAKCIFLSLSLPLSLGKVSIFNVSVVSDQINISNPSALVMTSQSNHKSKYGGVSSSFFTPKKCPKRSLYFMVMEILEMKRCAGMWVYRRKVVSFKR